ncbi:hypothetical protein MBANPS3_000839 [Mucor bainieri]
MNYFQKLPHELQFNIFHRLEDKSQLAACRLVCKQWDPIAERAIFSRTLVIKSEESFITQLYHHLANKPALALLIKSIAIYNHCYEGRSLLYKKLLQLVMSPNLEQIQGYLPSKNIESLFCQIIIHSPNKFNKIKVVPTDMDGRSDQSKKCLCALKDSLERMFLSIDGRKKNIVQDHLNEFTKLGYLELDYSNIQDIIELDLTLRRLKSATELIIRMAFIGKNYIPKSSDEMTAWLVQNVEKDERLKSLTEINNYEGNYRCNLVEYFVYKYPNLNLLRLDSFTYDTDVERVLQATHHIPHLILEESMLDSADDLHTVGRMMKSSSNTVEIVYEIDTVCWIQKACRVSGIQTSGFSVSLSSQTPQTHVRQFLLAVGGGMSKITKAVIDLYNPRDSGNSQEMMTLYDILRLVPDVQDFGFSDFSIKYQKLDGEDLVLHDLQRVELNFAKIDYRVITQLGSIAPNLGHLAISNSVIVGRNGMYTIVMPDSNLSSLTVHFKAGWVVHKNEAEWTAEETDAIEESIYLYIETELQPRAYYVWETNSLAVAMVPEKDVHTMQILVITVISMEKYDDDNDVRAWCIVEEPLIIVCIVSF